ncbi:hypothetical protein [Rheinheimera fenheensis]|uniref:hypothetical protein n=1 Tax=Rheinheimera fenheensis TaxID=3152295 RepID=UPI00325D2138
MRELVESALNDSLNQLLRSDGDILAMDVNERSISHRLASYLEPLFHGWNVDCEYNRNHDDPKRLEIRRRNIQSDDTQATTVFPDIIVHRRGTDENFVVIEMKKTSSQKSDHYDLEKLNAFKEQLGYQFAIFVKVRTGGNPGIDSVQWV